MIGLMVRRLKKKHEAELAAAPKPAAAGWFPDPRGKRAYRYFDGEHWTDSTTDAEK